MSVCVCLCCVCTRAHTYIHLCEDTQDFLPWEPLADRVIILAKKS